MTITLIAAMDRANVIGTGNRLPWRLPAEMAYFTKNTVGKTVLMGRKTFESLPKPLKDRRNVIMTRSEDLKIEGCEIVHSVEEALDRYANEELMVIGGADIYHQFLPFADRLMLSSVEADIEDGDAFFPKVQYNDWKLVRSIRHESDEKNKYGFTYNEYERLQSE